MSKLKRAIYLQFAGFLIVGLLLFLLGRIFPVAEWVAGVQQRVMQMGSWSAVWYVAVYVCCNVLLLPGGVLSLGGGFFFGLWWGFLIVLVGNVSAAGISFLISRRLGRNWLHAKLAQNPTFDALKPAVEREGWKIVLLSQLHPFFPTSLLNYLYGLTAIRFRTCILWVGIGQAPGLFLYTYLGTLGQLGLNLIVGKTHPRMVEYIFWGGGLVVSVAILFVLGRIAMRVLQEVDEKKNWEQMKETQQLKRKEVIEEEAWEAKSIGTR